MDLKKIKLMILHDLNIIFIKMHIYMKWIMLELFGKDFKATITKVLLRAIINSLETNEIMGFLSKEIEVF